MPDSVVYPAALPSDNALYISEFRHHRITHFANQHDHIDGIENFWNQGKRHMGKFNGIEQDDFYRFLEECAWRFNRGNHQKPSKQLKYCYEHTKH